MRKVIFLFATVFIITILTAISCTESKTNKQKEITKDELDTKALTLLQNNCFVCHNPDLEIDNRVAPPMFKIRNHYFTDSISKEEFVSNIFQFVSNPTEEKSIMPGAVRNFGLMPKQNFKEEDIKTIAAYIYENDVESDAWYAKWDSFKKNNIKQPTTSDLNYVDRGLNYANSTKAELGKNLLAAIKLYGTAGAVDFCNTKAIQLTDSMANAFKISIKRVSDKPRNAKNGASENEINYINELKHHLANGNKIAPKLFEKDGKMVGYYAIETNKMCMQCHGKKNVDITKETYNTINKLYPNDKAYNYSENEIRGIWVVEMQKN